MKKFPNQLGLSKVANTFVGRMDQMDRLKEIANRKNYPYKVKELSSRIQKEFDFFSKKEPSSKFEDLKKDLIFIKSIKEPTQNKEGIDLLVEKYGLK